MLIRALFILVLLLNCVFALPYTQDDRDRSIRLEEGQKSLQKQIDDLKIQMSDFKTDVQKQINDQGFILQSQIDDIKIFLYWGFGILFSGMGILIGFVLWDRRSVLTPVSDKQNRLEERERLLEVLEERERIVEKILKEYAKEEPKLNRIITSSGL